MKKIFQYIISALVVFWLVSCSFDDGSGGTTVVVPTTPASEYEVHTPSPVHNSIVRSTNVDFSWVADGEPESYTIVLGSTFRSMTPIAINITDRFINMPRLVEGNTYWWQVTATYNDTLSESSEIWTFTVDDLYPDGFTMVKHGMSTLTPHQVIMDFQVSNLNSDGISGLTVDDFEYFEDGDPIHDRESNEVVLRQTPFPYWLKTTIMIDNSTSIDATEFADLKQAAINFINLGLLPTQQVTVYYFSNKIVKVLSASRNRVDIVNSIAAIAPGDSTTNLYGAVIEGATPLHDQISRDSVQTSMLIVFTDGKDTQARHTLNEAIAAATNKKVVMVSLPKLTEIDLIVLRDLETEGFYYTHQASLNLLYQQLGAYVTKMHRYVNSFYQVEYSTPVRGNFYHQFMLRKRKNLYDGIGSNLSGQYNSREFF
ncbi:MAG: VWA domain-containing protein [Bacteroidetes bacterium]|nr:VWA domain-containing protein [Bacteroidota bacterium]